MQAINRQVLQGICRIGPATDDDSTPRLVQASDSLATAASFETQHYTTGDQQFKICAICTTTAMSSSSTGPACSMVLASFEESLSAMVDDGPTTLQAALEEPLGVLMV